MRNRLAIAVVGIVTLVLIGIGTGSARQRDAWEYAVHTTDSEGTLNKWGQDGWEVAAAYPWGNEVRVIMKRRKG
jgi:hypothetical protein